jgi:cell division transport system permease protein
MARRKIKAARQVGAPAARPRGARKRVDQLGLRAGVADRLLPTLVGAMSFLAALAIAGTLAAASLASHWQGDTASALTVQVTDPAAPAVHATGGSLTRLQAVLGILKASPNVSDIHQLSSDEMNRLLKPWLGEDAAQLNLTVPAVIAATWSQAGPPPAGPAPARPPPAATLQATLDAVAPGTLAETGAAWASRVAALTGSIQASAVTVLLIVALVAAAVIAVATRAGLAQRREAIEIIHGLGALDSDIASSFALRATQLAAVGAAIGAGVALPVLFWLARLAAPFAGILPPASGSAPSVQLALLALPAPLWAALAGLPAAAALIGWGTAQFTVRGWLRQLS